MAIMLIINAFSEEFYRPFFLSLFPLIHIKLDAKLNIILQIDIMSCNIIANTTPILTLLH